jgi:non-ribosomal peptide synthetase component F
MTALQTISKTLECGVFLYVQGERLRYRGSAGVLSHELRRHLEEHRDEIVQHLKRLQAQSPPRECQPSPIHPRAPGTRMVLSYAQQRLWFIHQLEGSVHYHATRAHQLTGRLDLDALKRALTTVVERHEALRTVIVEEDGIPYQGVQDRFELDLPLTDVSGLHGAEQEAAMHRLTAAAARQPFDLGRDLMLRVQVVILSPHTHAVVLTVHHLATDAWSQQILQQEMVALYAAYREGRPNPLPPVTLQYGDYAVWQRNWLQGEVLSAQLAFWKGALKDIPEVHGLPLDAERPVTPTHQGGSVVCTIDGQMLASIRALCTQHDVTLFVFLHTAVSVLLGRYSQDTDIVMGVPVAGRVLPDLDAVIGLFVNTVVLRVGLNGNPSFRELLARNKQHVLDALTHQHLPFELLVEELQPRRTTRYNPVFQILFNMPPPRRARLSLPGIRVQTLSGIGTSKFELTFTVIETAGELSIHFGYNADIFRATTIARMATSFRTLLASVLAAPGQRVGDLDLLTPGERHRLLTELNARRASPTYILDAAGQLVPEGALGELCVPVTASSDDTSSDVRDVSDARRFVPNPFADGRQDFLCRTGHLARWSPDGELQVIGRFADRLLIGGVPVSDALASPEVSQVPATETERRMQRVWRTVLPDRPIGVGDDFFRLGGHSLSMVVLIKRMAQEFDVDVPLATFIESPTIHALSRFVEQIDGRADAPPDDVVPSEGTRPLSFAQERLWRLERHIVGGEAEIATVALRFTGDLDVDALEASLNEIVQRHDVLRARVMAVEGRPVQVIADDVHLSIAVATRDDGTVPVDAVLDELLADEAVRPFDLARGPLVRATLLRLGRRDHILLVTLHPIASDAESTRIMAREIGVLYEARVARRPAPLAPLALQYADYAQWQRNTLQGERLRRLLHYWTSHWRTAAPRLAWPVVRSDPTTSTCRGDAVPLTLSRELASGLMTLCRRFDTTLQTVLVAALQTVLHRWSGHDEIVVGMAMARRDRFGTEALVGRFMDTLPLRTDLSGDPLFTTLLEHVGDVVLGAYAHRALPFELLVDAVQPNAEDAQAPFIQVALDLQPHALAVTLTLPGLTVTELTPILRTTRYDLSVRLVEGPAGLEGCLEYRTDLLERTAVEHLAEQLAAVLEAIMDNPARRISELPMQRERRGVSTVTMEGVGQARTVSRPRVSVIVPARGSVEPLARCLEALLREQTVPRAEFEVIVVDNGLERAADLRRRFPEITWAREEGIGSYAARNRGLAEATGEFVAFTDADCIPASDWLERALIALRTTDATLVGGTIEFVGTANGDLTCYERFEQAMFDWAKPQRMVNERGFAVTANLVAYRSIFDRVGPFDGDLRSSGDREWTQRAVAKGETLRYCREARVRHPSRASFPPMLKKIVRLRGGYIALARKQGFRVHASLLRRFTLLDPNMYTHAILSSQGRRVGARLVFFGGVMAMATAATVETFRVLCGAKGYRG